jgi:hypothetical protein
MKLNDESPIIVSLIDYQSIVTVVCSVHKRHRNRASITKKHAKKYSLSNFQTIIWKSLYFLYLYSTENTYSWNGFFCIIKYSLKCLQPVFHISGKV